MAKVILASSVDRKELLGKGLACLANGNYIGKVLGLVGDRVEFADGFVSASKLNLYQVVDPRIGR